MIEHREKVHSPSISCNDSLGESTFLHLHPTSPYFNQDLLAVTDDTGLGRDGHCHRPSRLELDNTLRQPLISFAISFMRLKMLQWYVSDVRCYRGAGNAWVNFGIVFVDPFYWRVLLAEITHVIICSRKVFLVIKYFQNAHQIVLR